MQTEYVVVMITAPSNEVAAEIADALLSAELAACVNILPPIQSHYIWQGQRQQEEEVLLIAKTRFELFDDTFIHAVKSVHPYEVPEIIALTIAAGSQDYLAWISDVTVK